MASSRAQASPGIEKRKRDRADPDASSYKKRRQGKVEKEAVAGATSRKGNADGADNQVSTSQGGIVESRSKGDIFNEASLHNWRISEPMGGRMSDVDPIFSADEKFLLVTFDTSLQVYSAADSLLVRRIALPVVGANNGAPYLVASALSQTSPNLVWLAASDGRIWRIDWTKGTGAQDCFRTKAGVIHDMTVGAATLNKTLTDVLIVSESLKGTTKLVAYDPTNLSNPQSHVLQNDSDKVNIVRTAAGGLILVAAAANTLVVGALKQSSMQSIQDLQYDFFSVNAVDDICALSIRHSPKRSGSRKKTSFDPSESLVDVAVGCVRGAIYVYSDLLSQLQNASKKGLDAPRKQHWHRKAVHSVAWSKDGNYLISGGSESVLVLWQLDTGKLDFLPHLAASIENIVVSPSGSSYAVHLDDNSTMVLSTAEMKPTTYVSGLQSIVFEAKKSKDDLVARVSENLNEINAPLAATIDPRDPSQMLICVGSSQQASRVGSLPVTPFLQRFDLGSFQSLSKQPLTRTNLTQLYTAPQGHPIIEPRACQLAFSYDGNWLATVDEWEPPERDVAALTEGSAAAAEEYTRERREIYLKFWKSKEDGTTMELSSRINGPHSTRQAEEVFDITADSVSTKFATIGEDGQVKVWAPHLRERDGLAATSSAGESLVSWSCVRTIALGESVKTQEDLVSEGHTTSRTSGALTYSEDGSILFVAYGSYNEVVIYIIDTETGEVRNSLHDVCKGAVKSLQLLNSCLIVLSEDLAVYDLVADELRYGVQLGDRSLTAVTMTHLAVDRKSQSFAVALPFLKATNGKLSRGAFSEIAIFDLEESQPQLMKKLPHLVTALLPAVGSSGFIAVDSAAQLWPIVEGTDSSNIARPLADLKLDDESSVEETAEQGKQAEAVILDGAEDEGSDDEQSGDAMDVDDDADGDDAYAAVVAPQRLAEIFDAAPAFAMPPIEDTFYKVVGLLSQNKGGAS
ncbi:WD40-repeat-containing domain protein [Coniella lustricola]|uniref:WD40-repeat-containing domain protein n=1 Tax=Coniella lustricola TaxID=2025994 RepID=A0A2T3A9D4_9PEZI|nr:WD40-repeat-containing domain protein [Coniella lustricola]